VLNLAAFIDRSIHNRSTIDRSIDRLRASGLVFPKEKPAHKCLETQIKNQQQQVFLELWRQTNELERPANRASFAFGGRSAVVVVVSEPARP
jgi:hypothetical protein